MCDPRRIQSVGDESGDTKVPSSSERSDCRKKRSSGEPSHGSVTFNAHGSAQDRGVTTSFEQYRQASPRHVQQGTTVA